jgi:hypothetical protein
MTKGIDQPDRRGRTGLHLAGVGLDRHALLSGPFAR